MAAVGIVPPWSAGCCQLAPTLGDQQLVGLGQQRRAEAVEDRLAVDPTRGPPRPDRGGRRSRNSVSAWVTSALIVWPWAWAVLRIRSARSVGSLTVNTTLAWGTSTCPCWRARSREGRGVGFPQAPR